MSYQPPIRFDAPYLSVPQVIVDVETTGTVPGSDRACEVGIALFEGAKFVESIGSYINPGMPIPAEATAIHGITNEMVADAGSLREFFVRSDVRELLKEAKQFGGYNTGFDKNFCLPDMPIDHAWPWLDTLVLVRNVDRFARGKGRHKLGAACERHGVVLEKAHSAEADAKATGELFYKLMPLAHVNHDRWSIGELLYWMRCEEAAEWKRFHEWIAKQPPMQQESTP